MALEANYRLETAEHVELEFDLAGPGSRFCAWVIDAFIMIALLVLLAILALLMFYGGSLWAAQDDIERAFVGWAVAFIIAAFFLITTFYHVIFEAWMGGRTPGKKQLGLRAIRDDGVGMRFTEVLIRNLLRPVDFLPAFYGLGALVSLLHPMHKRLGDLAAGTIVVKEGTPEDRAAPDASQVNAVTPSSAAGPTVLTPAEQQLVARFLDRRPELMLEARQEMAERLARPLYERYGGQWRSAEQYLERLVQGRQDES